MVVGWSNQTPPKPDIAFRWTPAQGMKPIISFGGGSQALGISDRNRVVGFQVVNQGVIGLTVLQGVKTALNITAVDASRNRGYERDIPEGALGEVGQGTKG